VFPTKINYICLCAGRDDCGQENDFSTSFGFGGKFLGLTGEAAKY
jgi:hypothetical protein